MGTVAGIAAIVSLLLSAYSIYRTNKANKELAEQQNLWNEEAATTAYNRGIEQWNRETDYGSQMSKLESAGINPALAYSSGVSIPSFSAVTPAHGVSPAKMQAMDFSGLQSGAQSLADYTLKKDFNDAQVKDLEASAALKKSEIPVKEQELLNLQQQVNESVERVNNLIASTNLLSAQEKTEIAREANIHWQEAMGDKQYELDAARVGAYVDLTKSQIDLNKSHIDLNDAVKRKTDAERRQLQRQTWEMIQTFGQRFLDIQLGNQLTETEIAQNLMYMKKLGVGYEYSNGQVRLVYDRDSRFGQESSDVYNTVESLLGLISQVFSFAGGFVVKSSGGSGRGRGRR